MASHISEIKWQYLLPVFLTRLKTAVEISGINRILCSKITNKAQPTFPFKRPFIILSAQNGICNCSVNFFIFTLNHAHLSLCFSLSVTHREHKRQSNPPVDNLVRCIAESAFGGLLLFSTLVYFLLRLVSTRVPAITRKEWSFFWAYVLMPADPLSLNKTFS